MAKHIFFHKSNGRDDFGTFEGKSRDCCHTSNDYNWYLQRAISWMDWRSEVRVINYNRHCAYFTYILLYNIYIYILLFYLSYFFNNRTVDSFLLAYGKGGMKFYYGDPYSKLDVVNKLYNLFHFFWLLWKRCSEISTKCFFD